MHNLFNQGNLGILLIIIQEKNFVLTSNLFIHLIIPKVSIFPSITTYNTDFQITLDKLANIESTLSSNLQLVTYLYRIKDIYLDNAISQ